MRVSVERIESPAQEAAAMRVRQEVFEREWGCRIANPMEDTKASLHLLARIQPAGDPIGALSVVDTTGDTGLHDSFALPFGRRTRAARYTQLAVLKPYRGWHIPLRLILEAHCAFVAPEHFEYDWLVFNAEQASSSLIYRLLGFRPGTNIFQTEYGRVRALVREENVSHLLEDWSRHSTMAGVNELPMAVGEYRTHRPTHWPNGRDESRLSQ